MGWSEDLGPPVAGKTPAIFRFMRKLSIFVDESGDFGKYDYHSPYYIISLVLHEQENEISSDLQKLEAEMRHCGYANHCIHVGPLIRQEYEYRNVRLDVRQQIAKRLMTFFRHVDIEWTAVYIEKRQIKDEVEAVVRLSKVLSTVIRDNLVYFQSFDKVITYYDNGQVGVNKILASVFNALLENVEFRKVIPSDYRLFQVADLVCTLILTEMKMADHNLSKSELRFFKDEKTLRKNYLKPLYQIEFAHSR